MKLHGVLGPRFSSKLARQHLAALAAVPQPITFDKGRSPHRAYIGDENFPKGHHFPEINPVLP